MFWCEKMDPGECFWVQRLPRQLLDRRRRVIQNNVPWCAIAIAGLAWFS